MRALHTLTLRIILIGALWMCLSGLLPSISAQTHLDVDPDTLPNLRPVGGFVRVFFYFLAGALLLLVGVLTALRYRVGTTLYKAATDAHWTADAIADTGERVDVTEVLGACEAIEHTGEPAQVAEPMPKTESPQQQGRLFTPASGVAWSESMLKAFLGTCMKVNCLARTWRESAARQVQSSNLADPREAELIRRLMQRWQEFHVDPDVGVFLEHATPAGKSRVCVISVTKDKHTLTEAAFNAGFVIESVGRYLRNTDLVYARSPGDYHAPTKDELLTMTPGEKDCLIRLTDVPDPWQAMIGRPEKPQ